MKHRHIYGNNRNQKGGALNQAASMMISQNGGATFGKFGHKHVLNKYGRPII